MYSECNIVIHIDAYKTRTETTVDRKHRQSRYVALNKIQHCPSQWKKSSKMVVSNLKIHQLLLVAHALPIKVIPPTMGVGTETQMCLLGRTVPLDEHVNTTICKAQYAVQTATRALT